MARELWLIRHAESIWNAEWRWQGHADPPLSARGSEQARALGSRLAGERLERLVASDLRRALETARPVGQPHGLVPVADARLRELDVGAWEGLRRAEIEQRDAPALARFDRGDPQAPAGGGESRAGLERRACAVLLELLADDRSLAVVTHLGVLRALLPDDEVENAGVRRLAAGELEAARARWRDALSPDRAPADGGPGSAPSATGGPADRARSASRTRTPRPRA